MSPSRPFEASAEVAEAIATGKPLVALESTIVTHGMPWPENLEMAKGVESLIRENGAVPATIAVIGGTLHVGLADRQLETLAATRDALKLSRADLAFAISERRTGSTTVAATMMAARLAGIDVFATGGIGGVHRGAGESFDVSADLDELARTPVVVVCAGAKAILDVPKTLEVLETRGVPVVTCGSDVFPAFWSRDSGIESPLSLPDAAAIARFQRTRAALGIDGGMLVANPVPGDAEIPRAEMEGYIAAALEAAARQKIAGKAVTPFLLSEIYRITEGRSLQANIRLVRNNARLAAEIARELAG